MSTHTARQGIRNYLTGQALCHTPRPADEADALLDAYRAEVRAEVLLEAADALALELTADGPTLPGYPLAVTSAVKHLRRMADTGQVAR